ncbi:hypothetical protein [Pseudomonas prosekii]|uniref:hypothetical protein n=1 Tax=Pseudomonas prosekii TaxID=1148509 RepID=UPI00387AE087
MNGLQDFGFFKISANENLLVKEFCNIFGWGMIVLVATLLTLSLIKKTTTYDIPRNVKAVFFVPFVVTTGMILAKSIPLCA